MERKTLPFSLKQEPGSLLSGVVEGYAAVFGNVDGGNDLIDPGAFTKTISENGGRIKMGWQHAAPFGVTTYIAEVGRDSLPPAVLQRAPGAAGGLYVRGQADMTAEDGDRLKRLASGSVDELSIGYEAVKATFEQDGERYIRRLKEVRLFEWSPVWVAMNPAAVITGVKGVTTEGQTDADDADPFGQLMALLREVKEGRVLSSANVTKVDGALAALRDAIEALENLLAAAEPAKGHSALRTGLDLRLAQSTYDVLVARALMAGLFGSTPWTTGPARTLPLERGRGCR